ncbi:aminoglycoside phosphotransferase family protein [Streptomyces sp. NPDC059382]|uniref:aminoglycoside phosphotransferase family protein n=1 Tax=Streptomyces sp. NPDC059382 TaxID=3346816 RepID=UPI0036749318
MDTFALYEEARRRGTILAGHYNHNVRVQSDAGPVIVRVRAGEREAMDLTLWPEAAVLAAIDPYVSSAPRLLHASCDPEFQIHEFVTGRRVDELVPDGKPLPEAVLGDLEGFFAAILRVPESVLPPVPVDWPGSGDTCGFAERLLDLVDEIRHRDDAGASRLYDALGVPEDPCSALRVRAHGLTPRPFKLLHADIHRQNMILADDEHVAFLDWELALWGDPVYDLADHLHKMAYTPTERTLVVDGWERAAPDDCRVGWRQDIDYYLAYEAVKSAVVDTIRWGRRISSALDADKRRGLCQELADKIAAAGPHWRAPDPLPTPQRIELAVDRLT